MTMATPVPSEDFSMLEVVLLSSVPSQYEFRGIAWYGVMSLDTRIVVGDKALHSMRFTEDGDLQILLRAESAPT